MNMIAESRVFGFAVQSGWETQWVTGAMRRQRVRREDGVELICIERSSCGRSPRLRLILATERAVIVSLVDELQAPVRKILGENTPLLIGVFQNNVVFDSAEGARVEAGLTSEG